MLKVKHKDIYIYRKNIGAEQLIFFLPGLFMNVEDSVFFNILEKEEKYSVLTYNLYNGTNNLNKSFEAMIGDFESILALSAKEYKKVHVISYSFGSEIILNSKDISKISSLSFWSPSFFYTQNISENLKVDTYNTELLIWENKKINKNLAHKLDKLDTEKNLNDQVFQISNFYVGSDDQLDLWRKLKTKYELNLFETEYGHMYTEEQIEQIYKITKDNLHNKN